MNNIKLTLGQAVLLIGAALGLVSFGYWLADSTTSQQSGTLKYPEQLAALEFTEAERDSMEANLDGFKEGYQQIRDFGLKNEHAPALVFDPRPEGFVIPEQQKTQWALPEQLKMPEDKNQLAFYTVAELAALIKSRQITSVELTKFFLDRLKRHGSTLECVITITEEMALEQARKADKEITSGNYRGSLHGIPYGVKDLLAVKGTKTTWGAMPYKEQQIDHTATVVRKLEEAGAVMVAKLTLGALAWGDVWYGGVTKNPWNLKEGSSGSSAGSASAVAAGLVPFALGTETLGSIVSPSTRCGVTGLRPTFGTVSRDGAMALSWTMDKIGPISRSAQDCALIYDVIRGKDSADATTVAASFNYNAKRSLADMKIGYLNKLFEQDYPTKKQDSLVLATLQELGADLQPVSLPDDLPVYAMSPILSVEAAAAFDALTTSDRDDMLVRQIRNAWPNVMRAARMVPAVEYVQANRMRKLLVERMHEVMKEYDVLIAPSFGGAQLMITNLTGHPAVVLPSGLNEQDTPANVSVTFLGNLYDEAAPLQVARIYQQATQWDDKHPQQFLN